MNNIRYETPSTLPFPGPRVAAGFGLVAAAILMVNLLKRASILPAVDATQLAAPLAQVFALIFVIGLWTAAAPPARWWAETAVAVNVVSLALLVGVEFVLNLVFPYSDGPHIAMLRQGPLGTALLAVSFIFLIGTWAYVAVLIATGRAPRAALALYAASVVPIALRTLFPEWALWIGLLGLAAAIVWLSVWLMRSRDGREA